MVSLLFSPTHISSSPWSQPGITWPIPNGKLNGIPRSWLKIWVKKRLWSTSVSVFVSVLGWRPKTFHDHPSQSLDSHWGFFAIIQPYCLHHIWMVAKCLSRPVCMLCSDGSRIFLRGGGANSQSWCANLYFWPKTAWKWKNLDPGGASLAPPLDPPVLC